jgi:Protein of unknown function (DUF3224)
LEHTMAFHATFEIDRWDENPFAEAPGTAKLTQANVTKTYSGDLAGTSETVWLMAYADDDHATFVGIERFTGSIGDKDGTLVLQHVGTFADGAAKADLSVVEGAGTGDLAAATGTGDLVADPSGKLTLRLGD